MANGSDQARTTTVGELKGRSKKPASSRGTGLSGLAGQLGNDGLMGRLEMGNTSRDDLLEFLVTRLETMRDAQQAEVELTKRMDNTFRTTLGDSRNMHDDLKPKRWVDAARLYETAAQALCSGQLQRGHSLVEQAVKAEKKAFDEVQVLVDFDKRLERGEGGMEAIAAPTADLACTDCPVPEGVDVADEIQQVTTGDHDQIKGQRRELDPWWTDLEEEEEEEEAGG